MTGGRAFSRRRGIIGREQLDDGQTRKTYLRAG
jgi:hypothetical protein